MHKPYHKHFTMYCRRLLSTIYTLLPPIGKLEYSLFIKSLRTGHQPIAHGFFGFFVVLKSFSSKWLFLRPPLDSLAHLCIRFWDNVVSPNYDFKRVKLFEGLTPSLVKNFITTRCPTVECTSCSVLFVLTTESNAAANRAGFSTPNKPNANRTLDHLAACFAKQWNYPFIFAVHRRIYFFIILIVLGTLKICRQSFSYRSDQHLLKQIFEKPK